MNTATRNVVPFPIRRKPVPMFSADPRHAGITFPRTASAAFRDAEYAGWFYPSPKRSLWKRIVRAVREVLAA
jgi:hypothetical protein